MELILQFVRENQRRKEESIQGRVVGSKEKSIARCLGSNAYLASPPWFCYKYVLLLFRHPRLILSKGCSATVKLPKSTTLEYFSFLSFVKESLTYYLMLAAKY